MLTLINTNRMVPPIAPVGLDYIAATARRARIDVELVDLCLAEDPDATIRQHFLQYQPELVGLSFRNVDDCFWPSGQSFLPELQKTIASALGNNPARLARDLIGDDPRFFPPEEETPMTESAPGDHNYNANQQLVNAIAAGERGAYWDILRRLRSAGGY